MASETSYAAVGVGVILSVFIVAAASADPTAAPTAAPSSSKNSLEEVCKQTAGHQDLCVATLSTDPSSKTADTAGLAQLAIQAAQRNASETATYLSSIYDDDSLENKTAQLQQCLEDCGERSVRHVCLCLLAAFLECYAWLTSTPGRVHAGTSRRWSSCRTRRRRWTRGRTASRRRWWWRARRR